MTKQIKYKHTLEDDWEERHVKEITLLDGHSAAICISPTTGQEIPVFLKGPKAPARWHWT